MTPKSCRTAFLLPLLAFTFFSCSEKQFTEPVVPPPGGGSPPPPSGVDSIAPGVSDVTPDNNATAVDRGTILRAVFTELVAESTATSATFLVVGTGPVTGTVAASGTNVTFTPAAPLAGEVTYTATLTTAIYDRAGNALPSDYTWSFTTAGQVPVANAGPDQSVGFGETVALDGTGSFDPDGKQLSYRWTQSAGPDVTGGAGSLTGASPSFTAPSSPTIVQFDLVVNDGLVASQPDPIRIFVNEVQSGIFVRPGGSDSNPGTREAPLQTVAAAIAAAASAGSDVYLARGTYTQSRFDLASGVSLYGGFDEQFENRSPALNPTILSGGTTAMSASSGVNDVRLDGLTVRSANATTAGGSSYAVILNGAREITFNQCALEAGNGAAGDAGLGGIIGFPGTEGSPGIDGNCQDPLSSGAGGPGGTGQGFSGGNGGAGGTPLSGYTGEDGSDGSGPGGGEGGDGTFISDRNHNAEDGEDGDAGAAGTDGAGGDSFGSLSAGYVPASGADGSADGTAGSGGGGGGGSSGNVIEDSGTGNGGGGGGSGGGPGSAGAGGSGGGGSFALFIVGSTDIVVRECALRTGRGGTGGAGGTGGLGGPGGAGGAGGRECRTTVGSGGNGGGGGAGGRGGHGGGGGGGPAVGTVWDGASSLTESGNSYSLGTPGVGGASAGDDGATGARQNTLRITGSGAPGSASRF